ncbi:LysR family transcriptional regulator [Motilimonas pumila]|uniref:LysR family transcriptional regulator n=1 Tax=Motilimonas pumila TaxID=2303987 RepID=A0A418YBD1_9GAMM|nr:LysR family transcriptional regulator [Motilimonas pumila]RJG40271.1 LysR family transcriptional regulator [Motilimonas pumila]
MNIHTSHQLNRVDLNLLVALDVLLKEQNVTHAAQVLFVSQSAMSRSLKRLRETFDDPLFIRTATGLTPTTKALELGQELQAILPQLNALFKQGQFNPAECNDTFSISLPTFLSSAVLPSLVLSLCNEAPNVSLIEMAAKSNPFDLLDKGKLDFAIHYTCPAESKYKASKIGSIYPKLYVRKNHPLANKPSSLQEILRYPVLAMNVEDDHKQTFNTPLQRILNQLKNQPRPKLRSTQTHVLMQIATHSDAVIFGMNALNSMAHFNAAFVDIHDFVDSPQYHVDLYLLRHQRTFTSAAHSWMANKLIETLKKSI